MDYKDIPRFPHSSYEIDVMWQSIEDHLAGQRFGLETLYTDPSVTA